MNDHELSALLAQSPGPFVGAAISVCDDDGEVSSAYRGVKLVGAAGRVDASTMFPAGSFSKVLTAFMLCQHAEAGRLDLDAPVVPLVPEIAQVSPWGGLITARHLLSHQSGLPDAFELLEDQAKVFSILDPAAAIEAPGKIFSYSNAAYVVAGVLLERLSGRTWADNIDHTFVQPLRLTHTIASATSAASPLLASDHVFGPEDGLAIVADMWPRVGDGFAAAGSTLACSIADMARLASVALLGRDVRSRAAPWLGEAMLAQMQTVQASMPGPSFLAGGWGLGWSIDRDGAVSHGGGSSVHVMGDPKTGRVSAFATNTPNGTHLGRDLNRQALALPAAPRPAISSGLNREDWTCFVGSYASRLIQVEIGRDGEALWAEVKPFGVRTSISHIGGRAFVGRIGELETELNFLGTPGTRATHVHCGLRAIKRV